MMLCLNESVANGLSKTGLSVKIGQVLPKLWNKFQTLPKFVYGVNSAFLRAIGFLCKTVKNSKDFWDTLYSLHLLFASALRSLTLAYARFALRTLPQTKFLAQFFLKF